jgi:transcriptional regulator with XRE-family HTH domain
VQEQNEKFFAGNLEFLLIRKHLNQVDLAEGIGVSQAAVSNYLNGAIPKGPTLVKISEFFGVAADDLLNKDFNSAGKEILSEVYARLRKRDFEELERRIEELSENQANLVLGLCLSLLEVIEDVKVQEWEKRKRRK